MPRDNLREEVLRAARADEVLARPGASIVVAFSGGPDSTALLHALAGLSRALSVRVVAAHFDHCWRPGSEADGEHASEVCGVLGITLYRGSAGPAPGRTEEAARRARHRFLEGVAAGQGAATVALGHTADDQAETVLMHLLRGSGLEGLAAMPIREGVRFRPLLRVTRERVLAYCGRHGLVPLNDPSNSDEAFLRNRVRHTVLPVLEGLNPRVREAFNRLAEAAAVEHSAIVEWARRFLEGVDPTSRAAFRALPAAVQVEVMRSIWGAASGGGPPPGGMSRLQAATTFVSEKRARPAQMRLGRGVFLRRDREIFEVVLDRDP
ncbi:MAG: tRNA lysidine(34) synthetase TilS [Candidatus Dormibacteria bacterium]